jgi:cytochrome b
VGHLPAAAVVVYAVAVGVLYRGTGVLAREDIHLLAQALALRRGAPYTEARA